MHGNTGQAPVPPAPHERPRTRTLHAALVLRDAVTDLPYNRVHAGVLAELREQVEAFAATPTGRPRVRTISADGTYYLSASVDVTLPDAPAEHPEPA